MTTLRAASIAVLALSAASSLWACANISLSSSSEQAPATVGTLHPADASASPANPAFDAGVPAPTFGNDAGGGTGASISFSPLCFVTPSAGNTCSCDPDDNASICDDAGVSSITPPPIVEDAGATAALDASVPIPLSCRVVSKGQAWADAGTGRDGAQCQTGADCADNFECVGTPGQCRHYCCAGNASCATSTNPSFCDVQTVSSSSSSSSEAVRVPVCMPVSSCTLMPATSDGEASGPGACGTDETCAVVKDDGTTSCVPVGTAQVGDPCEGDGTATGYGKADPYHCAAGLTCLGAVGSRSCFRLCLVAAPDCASGTTCTSSAQLFTNAAVGICQ